MIFYGPSGVGKTTVASIIAAGSGMQLHKLNGTTASTSDIKSVLADIGTLGAAGGILLYLDEIQYFNKRQQQSMLECVEQGTVTLIASTTENPYFYVYNALLSRCTVFEFKSLTADDIRAGLRSAAARLGAEDQSPVFIPEDALDYLAQSAGGDMRKAIGNLEFAVTAAPIENGCRTITLDMIQQVAARTAMRYDKLGDDHYDIVSAYQKSMRGSDPDAALHYLGRLLEAGDLPSACRRLMVCACEDVGLAWPQIIPIVKAAVDIANAVGLPEARLPLADAVVLVATAPKSNSAHDGINAAIADIQAGRTGPIPRQLQNKHYDGADAKVKGQHYIYPHDYPNHWVEQQYLPDAIKDRRYYQPGDNKNEQAFAQYWKKNQRRAVTMPELHCETITFPSSDGRHTSSAVLYTMPDKPVRAVIQLSHGMCEYVRRYAPMAEFYAAHGIALAGNDHLGHGDTAKAGEHGHYGEPDGRFSPVE